MTVGASVTNGWHDPQSSSLQTINSVCADELSEKVTGGRGRCDGIYAPQFALPTTYVIIDTIASAAAAAIGYFYIITSVSSENMKSYSSVLA